MGRRYDKTCKEANHTARPSKRSPTVTLTKLISRGRGLTDEGQAELELERKLYVGDPETRTQVYPSVT